MEDIQAAGLTFEFNINDEYDVDRAKHMFDKKTGEGFIAHYADPFGVEEGEMLEFDPQSGKIIFVLPLETDSATED